jgi:hypothetical protein
MIQLLRRQIKVQTLEERWLERARYLPLEAERFEILNSAAQGKITTGSSITILGTGAAVSETSIERLIFELDITPEHREVIRESLKASKAMNQSFDWIDSLDQSE